MNKDQKLYTLLLKETFEISNLTKNVNQYYSFLHYSDFNILCEKIMFNYGIKQRHFYFSKIQGLETECKKCWKYYLNPRNKSIKKYDIIYGKKFEYSFINFLNKLNIRSDKADKSHAILPDNLIIDSKGEILAYYEVKYHNAPFVWKYKYTPGRECYEGSITLDYEKVKKQIYETRNKTYLPVYYLHWVDFPCIKGVFFMSLEDTEKIVELGVEFARREREGNYILSKGTKKMVGYKNKIYPSIFKMQNLEKFIDLFI